MGKVFLFLEKTDEPNVKRIASYHHAPELLTEEELKLGILVDEVPQAENIPDKRAELFYNTDTQELFYKYFDVELPPMSPEQLIKDLQKELNAVKAENKTLMLALAESAEAQQQDKIENQLAIAELAELIATKEVL
ncbi:hypothetical protein FJQ98_03025 [Lysinibacillus agricola]|uniref:Bacteriophage SP-beta YorD domain-containing protein n=1 Tax=Lysinibacillus agricola TaxID=2590012 RepID=A0ABX7ASW6_9BACI|nr:MULTISPECIES: hypothetical protein [Lysinibacillus]KOS61730.1 hypothetical protein AN161_16340 [Lysinibacillus sp. FJAT-14222]QQP13063.1 hypothetical protein FJQ98_03025 [Lysinibacillus agricola]